MTTRRPGAPDLYGAAPDTQTDRPGPTGADPAGGSVVRWRSLVAVLAVVAGLVGVVAGVPAVRAQAMLSLTHRPTQFAALSFTDPLPERICSTLRAGTVSFAVHNQGSQPRTFGYQVVLTGGPTGQGTDQVPLPGTVDVAAGRTTAVEVAVPAAARGARQVDVLLAEADLSVRVTCPGAAG